MVGEGEIRESLEGCNGHYPQDYQVRYDAATATVLCQGSFRLRGTEEYAPILQVLTTAADALEAECLAIQPEGACEAVVHFWTLRGGMT